MRLGYKIKTPVLACLLTLSLGLACTSGDSTSFSTKGFSQEAIVYEHFATKRVVNYTQVISSILLVLDNSGSMWNNLVKLQEELFEFINDVVTQRFAAMQIAVTTTEAWDPSRGWTNLCPNHVVKTYDSQGNIRKAPDIEAEFQALVTKAGSNGRGSERYFHSVHDVFLTLGYDEDKKIINRTGCDFLDLNSFPPQYVVPGVQPAVMMAIISDEKLQNPSLSKFGPAGDPDEQAYLDYIKDVLDAAYGAGNYLEGHTHVFDPMKDGGYSDLTNLAPNGKSLDILSSDYSGLFDFVNQATETTSETTVVDIPLDYPPADGKVLVDIVTIGKVVSLKKENGDYVYDAQNNQVSLNADVVESIANGNPKAKAVLYYNPANFAPSSNNAPTAP